MQTGRGDIAYVRKFEYNDLDRVVSLANSTLTEYYSHELIFDISEQWRDGFMVYVFRDEIAGFVAGSRHSQTEARVLLLAVDLDMRRIGIGTALMNDFMKLCRDHGMMSIRLEVQTQNTAAIVFYRKLGFVIISTMKKYYTDLSDAYAMWRLL